MAQEQQQEISTEQLKELLAQVATQRDEAYKALGEVQVQARQLGALVQQLAAENRDLKHKAADGPEPFPPAKVSNSKSATAPKPASADP